MSKDVKPLTPTKRTKPYTIQELAALKDAQGPRAESLLDFLGVQATVEALDEALADNAALTERLRKMVERHLEAKCLVKDEPCFDPACCHEGEARHLLAQPHPGQSLLEELAKVTAQRHAARSEVAALLEERRELVEVLEKVRALLKLARAEVAFLSSFTARSVGEQLDSALALLSPKRGGGE